MRLALATAAVLLVASPAPAGDDDLILSIGDAAPAVDIAHWLKLGEAEEPLTTFEPGKVYVMEFWATWCGPCRRNMPHLTELQKQFADYDVTIVGVSDEPLPTVVQFLTKADDKGTLWTDKMGYTVATDPDRSVFFDYMLAAGQSAIPTAFIVGKTGRIEYIGNPGYPPGEFEAALDGVARDTWDRTAFAKKWDEKIAPFRAQIIPRLKLERAKRDGDWKAVLAQLDSMIAAEPDNLNVRMEKFRLLLTHLNRPRDGYALGEKIVKEHWQNARLLNGIAWTVVDDRDIASRDLDFALKVATRASALTDDEDPAILDTLARVYFERGDVAKAIELQRKAVEQGGDGPMADGLRESLERYEAAENADAD